MQNIQVIQPGQTRTRASRTPSFPIAGTMKPFGLYPLTVHPVLPGETLRHATTKWQVRSAPIENPMAGCWLETWWFYVKFTDIDRDLGEMFISDTFDPTPYQAAGDNERYFVKSGQINWVKRCMDRIHEAYFLDEGETARTIDNVNKIKIDNVSWYQNMIFRPADNVVDTSDSLDAIQQLSGYEMMLQMGMTEITYEKYLEQFGVQAVKADVGNPEILRFARSWVLPTAFVEPTTGQPSAVWRWKDEINLKKDIRFDEPGFLIQVASVRPKLYQGGLAASMVGNLWGFSDWFPVYNLQDPQSGVKVIKSDDAVFGAASDGSHDLLYDHRDLLSHGEQFVNDFTTQPYRLPTASDMSLNAADSNSSLRGEYASGNDVNDLFTTVAADEARVFYEGMTMLRIAGHIRDYTA